MDWDSFKTALFTQGIDPQAVEAGREFVEQEMAWHGSSAHSQSKTDDLGFAECGDITTFQKGVDQLKTIQFYSTVDETERKTQRAWKKFRKEPSKYFKRILLKTFWLTQ
jgi:hypothetical protein